MKTILVTILAFITITNSTFCQSKYDKAMQTALKLWGENKTEQAINMFERIANVEKNNWLPNYYIALINSTQVFMIKDKTKQDLVLRNAQKSLDKAKKIAPKNSEILTVQGMINTGWIVFNPQVNGQKYSPIAIGNYKEALSYNPNNPRAMYLLGDFLVRNAAFFNQDPSQYYGMIKKAIKLFDQDKAQIPYAPSWGKERAIQILKSYENKASK